MLGLGYYQNQGCRTACISLAQVEIWKRELLPLPTGFQFRQNLPGDFLQGFKHADALKRHRLDYGFILLAEFFVQCFGG